jgi:catechol 2,3-dioxygenase-like lactoylglutathione lyase family enzyme
MPAIELVMESALYVTDLERAVGFYRDVLGLHLMNEFDAERGAAFAVGPTVLLLFRAEETLKPGELPAHGATGTGHVAFRVPPEELPRWRQHLLDRGVAIEKEHSFGGNPPSIYFRDPDGNVLEFAVAAIWPWPASPA